VQQSVICLDDIAISLGATSRQVVYEAERVILA